MTHLHPKAVLLKSSIKTLNTAGQNFSKAAISVNAARQLILPIPTTNRQNVTTAQPKAVREKEVIDSGCSRHMTENKSYLLDYDEIDSVFVLLPLRRISKDGKITWQRNKKDERGIVIRNKARLVAQGYTQEEGSDYDEVFALVARIEAIRLFLAYVSFKDFVVYQMNVKSAFLYGKIDEEVYVCQPLGFEDPEFPDKVYKVEKALYGLHQAPRAWYETLSTYLLDNGFQRGQIDKTLFIKIVKCDILLVQMSTMGELTFFLRLQVTQKDDGIFISQDRYVDEIFKKFGFSTVKTTSTPMETLKPLLKDAEAEDVDVHLYRSMIGSLMYLTASRPDILYLKGQPKLGLWYTKDPPFDLEAYTDSDYAGASLGHEIHHRCCQVIGRDYVHGHYKKQTIVANSTTEAEYVTASSCCGQVLWIQNQMLDYGYNFMNTKIFIDNKSTICIVKNLVFHSKTKHIEIRHHFIRDSYKKRLIQVIKIHTDHNVADLLTKEDKMERDATIASSLEAEQDSEAQIKFEAASKQSNDPPVRALDL
ncbi:putative ribonuclease H-like domain-containing protein [Tanacetum coccineum]|uniref:Ribonuclease H-like domain-containing protein n=1 Tax=Tanacetum coccineum TaxID=301880 RepID=A0ABQ5CK93_9ASTR